MPHKRAKTPPQKILIIRLSAIGDNVMASPLIRAFNRKFPAAKIDWLVQPESEPLITHHPGLNRSIVWPTKRFKKLLKAKKMITLHREWWAAMNKVRREKYDWIVDTQGLLKSGIIAALSGARYKIGLGAREGCQWVIHDNVPKIHGKPRISSEYMDLAEFLELPVDPFDMEIPSSKESENSMSAWIEENKLSNGFICICPFTTRPQKHWIENHWVEFIKTWWEATHTPCVMLGGPGDKQASHAIESAVRAPEALINLAGEKFLSIPDASTLISKSKLLVGVDTGMTHMSIAHKRPTVCIFGSTVPYTETGQKNINIHFKDLECAPCRKHPTCDGRFDCMKQLESAEILESALQLYPKSG